MKPVCHFLLLLLTLPLGACQSPPPAAPAPVAPTPLTQLQAPASLGQWRLQGSISQGEKMRLARYQLGDDARQILDVSFYPLPDGWQHFTAQQSLERHFGMLAQQIATNASAKYHATRVEATSPQLHPASASLPPALSSRLTSHFADQQTRITLVSLTLFEGNFVRLTLTTDSSKADAMAPSLQAARIELLQQLAKKAPSAAHA